MLPVFALCFLVPIPPDSYDFVFLGRMKEIFAGFWRECRHVKVGQAICCRILAFPQANISCYSRIRISYERRPVTRIWFAMCCSQLFLERYHNKMLRFPSQWFYHGHVSNALNVYLKIVGSIKGCSEILVCIVEKTKVTGESIVYSLSKNRFFYSGEMCLSLLLSWLQVTLNNSYMYSFPLVLKY